MLQAVMSRASGGFAQGLASRKKKPCYYLQCTLPGGQACYYFVVPDRLKDKAMLRAVRSGAGCNLNDYGEIVESGWGRPDAALKARMAEAYDISFDKDT